MRTFAASFLVAFAVSGVLAQEKPSGSSLPKNDKLISLLRDLKDAKSCKDRDLILHRASTDTTLDGEAAAFVTKARKDFRAAAVLVLEDCLAAKRLCEVRAALELAEALVREDSAALEGGDRYFGSAPLFDHFSQLGDWRAALGDGATALAHYDSALSRLRRLHPLAVAQGWLKEYQAGVDRIRTKIAEVKR